MTSTDPTRRDVDPTRLERSDVDRAKDAARTQIWDALAREHAAQPNVHGKIPAFVGADVAAARLAALPVWKHARIIKAVPTGPSCPSGAGPWPRERSSTWPFRSWPPSSPSGCSTPGT